MHSFEAPNPAAIVRRARLHSGLSQGAFAIELGRSQAVISRYETGKVEPPWAVVMQCMHLLGESSQAFSATEGPGWNAVLSALHSLNTAIRQMHKEAARPNS